MKRFITFALSSLALFWGGCASNGPESYSESRTRTDTPVEATKVEKESGKTVTTEETIRQVHSTGVVVD